METTPEYLARPACAVCGQYLDLLPERRRGPRRRYCSNRCRQAAYRQRQEAKRQKRLAEAAAARKWRDALATVDVNQVLGAYREKVRWFKVLPKQGEGEAENERE